ncbi:MAG TPA: DUF6452 family protein [Bacteroidales bacterium]|nr:DUF6452 family protein [Bacteroidales bacterium]
MNRKIFFLILSAWIVASLTSCTPGSCFEKTDSLLDVTFYDSVTKKVITPDSLTVFGLGIDTARIYSASRGIKKASLPLNSAADNSIFIITINKITDTLSVFYSSYPHLISKECGYTFYHQIDSLFHSRNAIHSILIIKRTVTNEDEDNLHLYY